MRAAAVLALAAAVVAVSAGASGARPSLGIRAVVSGLESPVYVAFAPGEPRTLYVVEQAGRILAVQGSTRRVFLDIRHRVRSGGEQGLLSVAFPRSYATSRRLVVDYTDLGGNTRVVEFRSNGSVADPGSARELLFVHQPYANHNGGQLQFGPDGLLYAGMGDGGSGGDPENRAQNRSTRLGKLLRIDTAKPGARWQIVGYGVRNPWRFSFDRANGDLWIGDVGQGSWEEVDHRTRAQLARVWNYGWPVREGTHRFKDAPLDRSSPLVAPVAEYSHADGSCSITGGYVYRGAAVPAARGRYFYGDYCTGVVWSLAGTTPRREPFTVRSLVSFGEDAAGELYVVSLDGVVYRLAG